VSLMRRTYPLVSGRNWISSRSPCVPARAVPRRSTDFIFPLRRASVAPNACSMPFHAAFMSVLGFDEKFGNAFIKT
jgi:hypothetical protein